MNSPHKTDCGYIPYHLMDHEFRYKMVDKSINTVYNNLKAGFKNGQKSR